MKTVYHAAGDRGKVDFGWLKSHHSFSFGHWYNPEKTNFGALRVLNDDQVRGAAGFGTHPHDNMEIVSIPLSGAIAHKDSTGTDGLINTGDVQIMSAGSGIQHSEYNASKTEAVNFLQIWVIPKKENIEPRYEQKTFSEAERKNNWQVVVSADPKDEAIWINQDSIFSLLQLDAGRSISYTPRFEGNGVYFFLLEGEVSIANQILTKRDALGVWEADAIALKATAQAQVLAIEVPMLTAT
jgi:quercetin 2,3-dioxygenase